MVKGRLRFSRHYAFIFIVFLLFLTTISIFYNINYLKEHKATILQIFSKSSEKLETKVPVVNQGLEILDPNIKGIDTIFAIAPRNTSSQRYQLLEKNQESTKIPFTFIPQEDVNSAAVKELLEYTTISPMRAGCYQSHLKIWKTIVEHKINVSIVLEDDVELERNFREKIEWLLPQLTSPFPDVLLIGHCYSGPFRADAIYGDVQFFACTHSYLVTFSGANKMVRFLDRDPLRFNDAIDLAMDRLRKMGLLSIKMVYKPLSRQLPRRFIQGDKVSSGQGELPSQLLDDPAIMSNEEYLKWINGNLN